MLGKNIDIFLMSDTKLNVPLVQFKIEGLPPHIGMIETIKEVTFYCMLGRLFHHVHCNVNHNAI